MGVNSKFAVELFNLPDCAHIVFVTPDGRVTTLPKPVPLRICKMRWTVDSDLVFLQGGPWIHPLVKGKSRVLVAGNGAFMFPDAYEEDSDVQKGASVGLVITDTGFFNFNGEAPAALAKILSKFAKLEGKPYKKENREKKLKIMMANLATKGMEVGAEKATDLIEYAGERQKAKSGEATSEDVKVLALKFGKIVTDQLFQHVTEKQEAKSGKAVKHTAKGVKYTTYATVKVPEYVARRVEKLSRGAVAADGSSKKTILKGLENSAKQISNSLKNESIAVVKHQYRSEAGDNYEESMSAAGKAAMTYMDIQSLGN